MLIFNPVQGVDSSSFLIEMFLGKDWIYGWSNELVSSGGDEERSWGGGVRRGDLFSMFVEGLLESEKIQKSELSRLVITL